MIAARDAREPRLPQPDVAETQWCERRLLALEHEVARVLADAAPDVA